MKVGKHFDVQALAHRLVLVEVYFEEQDVFVGLRNFAELTSENTTLSLSLRVIVKDQSLVEY